MRQELEIQVGSSAYDNYSLDNQCQSEMTLAMEEQRRNFLSSLDDAMAPLMLESPKYQTCIKFEVKGAKDLLFGEKMF